MWLLSIFTDPITGKASHSKIWANVACAAATYKFIMMANPSYEIWMAYLGIVGGYAVARRWIAVKAEEKHEERGH